MFKSKTGMVEDNTGLVQKIPTPLQQPKPAPVGEVTGPVRAHQADTFPVVDGPFTGPELVAPAEEPVMGSFASAGVSDDMHSVEHPLADALPVSSDEPLFGADTSPDGLDSEEGELSESDTDKPDKNEEMSYRETVRSIRTFMGWKFIPDFELEYSDPISPTIRGVEKF